MSCKKPIPARNRFDPLIVPIAHHTQVRENKQSMQTTFRLADLGLGRRVARRFRSRLTESYHFSGNDELEVESVLEEDDSWLDIRAGGLWAEQRLADRRAEHRAALRAGQWFAWRIYRYGQGGQRISESGDQDVAEKCFGCILRLVARRAADWGAARRADWRAAPRADWPADQSRALFRPVRRAAPRAARRIKSGRFRRDQALCVKANSLAKGLYAVRLDSSTTAPS
jgi:hypothetical protein